MKRKAKSKTDLVKVPALPPDQVAQVYNWVLQGASEHDITEAIQKTYPDAAPMPLIVAAIKRVCEAAEAEPTVIRGWCIECTRYVYQRAVESADFSTALRAINQLSRLAN